MTAPYNPLPSHAATDSQEEGLIAIIKDVDDLTPSVTPRTLDLDAETTAKNKYEPAHMSLLFLFTKEDADTALAVRLRTEGKIKGNISRPSSREARDGHLTDSLFLQSSCSSPHRSCQPKSRPTSSWLSSSTLTKSCLVVQGYGDEEKKSLLTQSPTIQRCTQRLILALAPTYLLEVEIHTRPRVPDAPAN